ncbi:MAG: hypothetical protein LBT14_12810, partial [Treponema sp.]|nr:hypothetical protein [Treponema sp.]
EEGLKFSGAVKTGILFSATTEKTAHDDDGSEIAPDPTITMYSDDADMDIGRFDLDAAYTKANYGVVLGLRAEGNPDLPLTLRNGYAWADLASKKLNMKVGKIDDGVWTGGGEQDFDISTGWGFRLEVKPIDGLNVGLFLTGPNNDEGVPWFTIDNGVGLPSIGDFLLETAIGAQYEHAKFAVSAGLKLDGKGDGPNTGIIESDDFSDPGDILKGSDENFGYTNESDSPPYPPAYYDNKAGLGFYIGANIKAVDKLTAVIEAAFSNLGAFGGTIDEGKISDTPIKRKSYYEPEGIGTIWINEHFAYQVLDPLAVGLVMHQYIFGGSARSGDDATQAKLSPELRFTPYVEYALNSALKLGLDVRFRVKPDYYALKLDIKPKVTYTLSESAKLVAFYDIDIQKLGEAVKTDPETVIANAVQLDFVWTF